MAIHHALTDRLYTYAHLHPHLTFEGCKYTCCSFIFSLQTLETIRTPAVHKDASSFPHRLSIKVGVHINTCTHQYMYTHTQTCKHVQTCTNMYRHVQICTNIVRPTDTCTLHPHDSFSVSEVKRVLQSELLGKVGVVWSLDLVEVYRLTHSQQTNFHRRSSLHTCQLHTQDFSICTISYT